MISENVLIYRKIRISFVQYINPLFGIVIHYAVHITTSELCMCITQHTISITLCFKDSIHDRTFSGCAQGLKFPMMNFYMWSYEYKNHSVLSIIKQIH